MKKKITSMACGIAAASIFAIALCACDDSSSSPDYNETNSSAIEKDNPNSSGNDDTLSSSDVPPTSSNSAPTSSNTTTSSDTPSSSNDTPASSETVPESSSAITPASSANALSSSSNEMCIDMKRMCPPCDNSKDGPGCPVTNDPCNQCEEEGQQVKGCTDGLTYVCSERLWKPVNSEPICKHITDYDGMTQNGNCNSDTDFDIVTDCVTGEEYRCALNYWTRVNVCAPGSDCDGDGIPDGIAMPDNTPCDTAGAFMEFYSRTYICQDGKWVYAPAPNRITENATDVSAMGRGGPAVSPRVVKVKSASGSVTFRDDGVLVDDRCTFNGLKAELSGDTLYATILYPGCTTNGGHMGVITFTLSNDFANAKYIKYDNNDNIYEIFETNELLPCGNTSSCVKCGDGLAC